MNKCQVLHGFGLKKQNLMNMSSIGLASNMNADHQVVVNLNYSQLSIATFQNPVLEATVYPLKIREREREGNAKGPITFAWIFRLRIEKWARLVVEETLLCFKPPKQSTKTKPPKQISLSVTVSVCVCVCFVPCWRL